MHVCVMGDSWAGNIDFNRGIFTKLFGKLGFTVTNISAGGASNTGQLKMLEYQNLGQGKKFDCVLWVYTEPVRDFTEFVSLDYGNDINAKAELFPDLTYEQFYKDLKYIANQSFQYAQRLSDTYDLPFITIGGAGLIDECIINYTFSRWTLPSWNKLISQLSEMPINCYSHHVVKMVQHHKYDKAEVLQEIDRIQILDNIMQNDKIKYPDQCHPALELYPDLVDSVVLHLKDIK